MPSPLGLSGHLPTAPIQPAPPGHSLMIIIGFLSRNPFRPNDLGDEPVTGPENAKGTRCRGPLEDLPLPYPCNS